MKKWTITFLGTIQELDLEPGDERLFSCRFFDREAEALKAKLSMDLILLEKKKAEIRDTVGRIYELEGVDETVKILKEEFENARKGEAGKDNANAGGEVVSSGRPEETDVR